MKSDKINKLPGISYAVKEDPFYSELRKRINHYFNSNHISRLATSKMYLKTTVLITLWIGLYALILSDLFAGIYLILLQVSWHFTMFLMSVGIAHDGSHNAFSAKKWVNRTMTKVFDLIGINSYMWKFNHILSHHNAPNIPIYDSAIYSFSIFRLHPKAKHYPIHRFQAYYIFLIYSLATLFKLFFLDFFSFGRKRIGYINMKKPPYSQILWLAFTKFTVITYTLVIPLWVLSAPSIDIITGFLLGHLICGVALGIIFQVTHLFDETQWPEPDEKGVIQNSFPNHIMQTTSDFAVNNPIATWISGGLNMHVVHHLFPGFSQVHLPAMTKILQQTAKEFNVKHKVYPNVRSAIISHIRTLHQLGNP